MEQGEGGCGVALLHLGHAVQSLNGRSHQAIVGLSPCLQLGSPPRCAIKGRTAHTVTWHANDRTEHATRDSHYSRKSNGDVGSMGLRHEKDYAGEAQQ
jgi:hypothetical protein